VSRRSTVVFPVSTIATWYGDYQVSPSHCGSTAKALSPIAARSELSETSVPTWQAATVALAPAGIYGLIPTVIASDRREPSRAFRWR
jgi:hypothetical protein